MTTRTRLDKASTKLSPKQVVLLTLKEAHSFESASAYAKKKIRMGKDGDICARIEASVMGTLPEKRDRSSGKYSPDTTHSLREAQREGMFLWGLAVQCNRVLMEGQEAINLRWMMWNMSILLLSEWDGNMPKVDAETVPLTLDQVMDEIRALRADLVAHSGAIAIIEKTYFGGQEVLFPDMRKWLDRRHSDVVKLLSAMDKSIRSKSMKQWAQLLKRDEEEVEALLGPMREPSGDALRLAEKKASTWLARFWVRLVQSNVHDRMDEREAATACLLELSKVLDQITQ